MKNLTKIDELLKMRNYALGNADKAIGAARNKELSIESCSNLLDEAEKQIGYATEYFSQAKQLFLELYN